MLLALLLALPALALPTIDGSELGQYQLPVGIDVGVAPRELGLADVEQIDFLFITDNAGLPVVRDQALWLRFRLDNRTGDHDLRWLANPQSTRLDHFVAHVRDNGGQWRRTALSDRVPFTQRPLPYRKLAYTDSVPAGGYSDVYLQLYSATHDWVKPAVQLWERGYFDNQAQQKNLLLGAYYGTMATLILMTLLFTAVLRDTGLLHYGLFLLSGALMWATINGFAAQYLWPNNIYLHNEGFPLTLLLFAVTALQFSKSFLSTRDFMPTIHNLFSAWQLFVLIALTTRLLGLSSAELLDLSVLMLAFLMLLPVATWQAWRRGVDQVLWFAVGWLIYGCGYLLILVLDSTDWLPPAASSDIAQIASLLQALILTMAMGERLLRLDRDRLRAIELAHQDPLTGLGNRRLLIQEHETMRLRFHHSGVPVYLILLDVDHFKAINDRHGHGAGDHVICELANLLRRISRNDDVAVRLGGEEFALLLSADSDTVAWHIAERIRRQFAATPSLYGQNQLIAHTLSAGVARVMSRDRELGYRDMLALADEAMYRAKASGRNRTVFANATEPLVPLAEEQG